MIKNTPPTNDPDASQRSRRQSASCSPAQADDDNESMELLELLQRAIGRDSPAELDDPYDPLLVLPALVDIVLEERRRSELRLFALRHLRCAAFGNWPLFPAFDERGAFGAGKRMPSHQRLWHACFVALADEAPRLLPLVEQGDQAIALAAMALMSPFHRHATALAGSLQRLYRDARTDDWRAGNALVVAAILRCPGASGDADAALARPRSDEHRTLAAIARIVAGAAAEETEQATACDAFLQAGTGTFRCLFPVNDTVAATLRLLGERAPNILLDLVPVSKRYFPLESDEGGKPQVKVLLELAFPPRKAKPWGRATPAHPRDLSAFQRSVVEALLLHPGWDAPGALNAGNNDAMARHFHQAGLPRDRPAVRRWFSESLS